MKKYIYSRARNTRRKDAKRYFVNRMLSPDQGSDFEKSMGCLIPILKIPGAKSTLVSLVEPLLLRRGYDALVLESYGVIAGHTAYQVHSDSSLHIFACELRPEFRGKGLGFAMCADVIAEARRRRLSRVRIGGGNHPATNRIHEKMRAEESIENFVVCADNWVELKYTSGRLRI